MKKAGFIVILLLLPLLADAQKVERIYVSTDRTSYVSGERVWCSLFCADADGRLGGDSAVAYLELISSAGTAVESKVGMLGGRGGGSFLIPRSVPTGTYRLLAYTSAGSVSMTGSRLLSVYNPFTTARVKDGVQVTEACPAPVESVAEGTSPVSLRFEEGECILSSDAPVTLSLSVYRPDSLSQFPLPSILAFAAGGEAVDAGPVSYDGEVIRARANRVPVGALAYLSSAGSPSDTYISSVTDDGSIVFHTGNIYGDRELVCEVESGSDLAHIDLESPFIHPDAGDLPLLMLSGSQAEDILHRRRLLSAQPEMDTLVQFLPYREDLLFEGTQWERYHLDDYTRFPTVQEVISEIVSGVRLGRANGRPVFRVLVTDGTEARKDYRENTLVMMDGVVVSDINLILQFDAMLLEDVEVSRHPFVIGYTPFGGAVNFITKNNYVTSLHFPDRVRVVDFKGVSYPVACRAGESGSDLLFWHPLLELQPGEEIRISAEGFSDGVRVVAEGFRTDTFGVFRFLENK